MYPMCTPYRRFDLFLLSPSKEDQSRPRNGRLDLCGNGRWSDHSVIARTSDQRDAGELKG